MQRDVYIANFITLCRAVLNRDAALLEAIDPETGKTMMVVCAANRQANGILDLVPLASLLDAPKQLAFPSPPVDPTWQPEMN